MKIVEVIETSDGRLFPRDQEKVASMHETRLKIETYYQAHPIFGYSDSQVSFSELYDWIVLCPYILIIDTTEVPNNEKG